MRRMRFEMCITYSNIDFEILHTVKTTNESQTCNGITASHAVVVWSVPGSAVVLVVVWSVQGWVISVLPYRKVYAILVYLMPVSERTSVFDERPKHWGLKMLDHKEPGKEYVCAP